MKIVLVKNITTINQMLVKLGVEIIEEVKKGEITLNEAVEYIMPTDGLSIYDTFRLMTALDLVWHHSRTFITEEYEPTHFNDVADYELAREIARRTNLSMNF